MDLQRLSPSRKTTLHFHIWLEVFPRFRTFWSFLRNLVFLVLFCHFGYFLAVCNFFYQKLNVFSFFRRQRDAAAAAAASANRHSAQIAASKLKMETGNGNGYNNDSSLLSQAFHSPQDLQDRSPDVIPHFTTTGGGKFKVKFIDKVKKI